MKRSLLLRQLKTDTFDLGVTLAEIVPRETSKVKTESG